MTPKQNNMTKKDWLDFIKKQKKLSILGNQNNNIGWEDRFDKGWNNINDNDNLSKIRKSFVKSFISQELENQRKEIANAIRKADCTGKNGLKIIKTI